MTPRVLPHALVITLALFLMLLASISAAHKAPPPMRRVDQPRCFPVGTWGVDGFPMCPDFRSYERMDA